MQLTRRRRSKQVTFLLPLHTDVFSLTTNNQGQGAGQAIEDAYVIEELLGKVTDKAQIPLAFKAYDIIRRPRSLKIVSTSMEAARLVSLSQEGVGDDPVKLKEQLDWRYDWVSYRQYSRCELRLTTYRSGTGISRARREMRLQRLNICLIRKWASKS